MKHQLTRSINRLNRTLSKNAPSILSGMALTGVVLTAITSAKCTVKAIDLLEISREEKSEELSKKEVATIVVKAYTPAAASVIFTSMCIVSANNIANRRQIALLSAYVLKDRKLREYKSELGKEKVEEIESSIAKKKIEKSDSIECSKINSGEQLFYERFTGRYFRSNLHDVVTAEYYINRTFEERGYAYLNDFYLYLGIDTTNFGEDVGWSIDVFEKTGLPYWIDFENREYNNYISIDYMVDPSPSFLDEWR